MHSWLVQAPIVLINLGTLHRPEQSDVRNIALALRDVLRSERHRNVHMLWKLSKPEFSTEATTLLGKICR